MQQNRSKNLQQTCCSEKMVMSAAMLPQHFLFVCDCFRFSLAVNNNFAAMKSGHVSSNFAEAKHGHVSKQINAAKLAKLAANLQQRKTVE